MKEIYPNPFNPVTYITYYVGEISTINVAIYDINGKVVEQLINQQQVPGQYDLMWNAGDNPTGLYFVKLMAGSYQETQKIMLS